MQALIIISIVFVALCYVSYRMMKDGKTYGYSEPDEEEPIKQYEVPNNHSLDNIFDTKSVNLQLKRYAHNYQDYLDYLDTKEWKEKKWLRFFIDGGKCQECGAKLEFKQSHCHHKSYDWLYEEPMEDLETLCRYCHIEIRHAGREQKS